MSARRATVGASKAAPGTRAAAATGPQALEVLLTPFELPGCPVKGRSLVVIDVLRLATTVCYALHHGAAQVIPVGSIEDATRLAASLDREVTLLCGEREGDRIEGFHLGNSPREYASAVVGGKTLVITTSNGTQAVEAGEGAREIALAGLVNVGATARWIREREGTVLIVCSGSGGRFALEDAVAAGLLVGQVRRLAPSSLALGDGAEAAVALAAGHRRDLPAMLAACEDGRVLAARGYADDLPVCAGLDRLDIVPLVREGRISGLDSRRSEGLP